MEIWRTATNPWGQEILVGIAWNLMWAALFAGILFTVGHAIYVKIVAQPEPAAAPPASGVPERVERHSPASRGFHWLMAASMFVLLITAFFPVVGIRFPWVTIHWIAGIALLALILFHIVHATVWQDWKAVWVGKEDVEEGSEAVRRFLSRAQEPEPRTGKYPLDQKLYHHAASLVTIGTIVTGVLMMFRIDTVFWAGNPYFLSDGAWGLMFVLHGICGVALITLVIAHVYFAIRPEKRWMTRSMIKGWITRDEYLEHFDPELWAAPAHRPRELADPGAGRGPDREVLGRA